MRKDYMKTKRKQCFVSLNVRRGGSAGAKGNLNDIKLVTKVEDLLFFNMLTHGKIVII